MKSFTLCVFSNSQTEKTRDAAFSWPFEFRVHTDLVHVEHVDVHVYEGLHERAHTCIFGARVLSVCADLVESGKLDLQLDDVPSKANRVTTVKGASANYVTPKMQIFDPPPPHPFRNAKTRGFGSNVTQK